MQGLDRVSLISLIQSTPGGASHSYGMRKVGPKSGPSQDLPAATPLALCPTVTDHHCHSFCCPTVILGRNSQPLLLQLTEQPSLTVPASSMTANTASKPKSSCNLFCSCINNHHKLSWLPLRLPHQSVAHLTNIDGSRRLYFRSWLLQMTAPHSCSLCPHTSCTCFRWCPPIYKKLLTYPQQSHLQTSTAVHKQTDGQQTEDSAHVLILPFVYRSSIPLTSIEAFLEISIPCTAQFVL